MSKYVVSARKYRPARFEDVVGQSHVSITLKNAFQNNQLAHAFLFCGPRGVGKTTCARILAKVLNCQEIGGDFEPCNTCASCKAFNENASFNIIELDAASNNSVEHIRALIEQVRFQPQQGKYKVFIIDEVHMLSQQAFNAFLKTLEEPPAYAVFILATTEKHKIIPTILSRCQIFDFRRIQAADMVEHLEKICRTENIAYEQDALHIVAQKADGALRDALSIFDRMLAFSGNTLKYEDVIANLNVLDYDHYFKLIDHLLTEDSNAVLLLYDEILRLGFEGDIFLNGLMEHLRNLLVCKDTETLKLLEVGENLKERYRKQAGLSSRAFLLNALNLSNQCDLTFKNARNKRLHIELALLKISHLQRLIKAEEKLLSPIQEKKTPEPRTVDQVIDFQEDKKDVQHPVLPNPLTAPVATEAANVLSLESLLAVEAISSGMEKNKARQAPVLSVENVKKAWKDLAAQHNNMAVKNLLLKVDLGLDGKAIKAKVQSVLAENTIRQERELLDNLRQHFDEKDLSLNILVEKDSTAPKETNARILSDKDKYMTIRREYPILDALQQKFGLRFEE